MKLWLLALLAAAGCSSEPDPNSPIVPCAEAGGVTMCEVGCAKAIDLHRMCIAQTDPGGTAASCEQLTYMGIEGCCAPALRRLAQAHHRSSALSQDVLRAHARACWAAAGDLDVEIYLREREPQQRLRGCCAPKAVRSCRDTRVTSA